MLLRTLKSFIEYLFFIPVNFVARRCSFRSAGRLGWAMGGFVWRRIPYRRDVSIGNLRLAFPAMSAGEIDAIAERAYRGYGRALMELLWSGGAGEEELRSVMTLGNPAVPLGALARGKGLILLSGHFGAWEFVVTSLALLLGHPVTAVAQPQRNRFIDRVITANRNRFGSGTVTMHRAPREAIALLRAGRIVAMLGDQSGPRESIFIDFFGRPAATHRGAAAFSLKCDAPIVMFFILRQEDGTYRVTFEEVDRTGLPARGEAGIVELTRRHAAILERYIRAHPDHWLWMHRRWKHTAYYEALAGSAKEREAAGEGV
ncbi:MAG TPA: lysophospholipid acyltransferase family protein [Bacteroidota bacterium]|nr:lysophospholipid acyltransferase family protein [Bacteroidota bacterium]